MELRKLNMKLMFTYLELIEQLSKDPTNFSAEEKKIRTVLINMHHLINEYRPRQAKDTLRMMVQDQIKKKSELTEQLKSQCEEMEAALANLRQSVEERSAEIQRAQEAFERSGDEATAAMEVEDSAGESNHSGWLFEARQKLFARLTSSSLPPAFPQIQGPASSA
ncbi:Mediator of RNA polymerase II transcription subunit 7 [Spiromyces aspiralis]|uniref:Mediator of RNA polymerase II transcription subunit 7 n=1 Tax=Spiromyces aspiralis TaxID=68401 RepID=A0ACC1HGP7_9FUNG|nr:Mediator of RNA polymerase II transcription subunit 7 [Spiromyces aspiralis]